VIVAIKSAIWLAWSILTVLTPETRCNDCRTIGGHSTQLAFLISRTTVFSAACTGQDSNVAANAAQIRG